MLPVAYAHHKHSSGSIINSSSGNDGRLYEAHLMSTVWLLFCSRRATWTGVTFIGACCGCCTCCGCACGPAGGAGGCSCWKAGGTCTPGSCALALSDTIPTSAVIITPRIIAAALCSALRAALRFVNNTIVCTDDCACHACIPLCLGDREPRRQQGSRASHRSWHSVISSPVSWCPILTQCMLSTDQSWVSQPLLVRGNLMQP